MLSWYEVYAEKEVPPENIWEDSEGLDLWWKDVEERRNSTDDEPDEPSPGYESTPMLSNDLARELRNRD